MPFLRQEGLVESITCHPEVMRGKPVIRGSRPTVDFVPDPPAPGASVQEIIQETIQGHEGLPEVFQPTSLGQIFAGPSFHVPGSRNPEMEFPVNECSGPRAVKRLRGKSHQVFSVHEEARGPKRENQSLRLEKTLGK